MSNLLDTLGQREHPRKGPSGRDDDHSVFLDAWLTADGNSLKSLTANLMPLVEPPSANRKRAVRSDARENLETCLENVVANLVAWTMAPNVDPECILAVPTANTAPSRYQKFDYPNHLLRGVLGSLADDGLITIHPYVFKQRATTVEPTPKLVGLMQRHGVRPKDVGRSAWGETVWLSAREDGGRAFGDQPIPKSLVHYTDTNETAHLRGETHRLNAFINEAHIEFDGEATGPIALRRMFLLRSKADPHRFELNGRLSGSGTWWMNLKSDKRYRTTIAGEDIADLDWSNLFARLVYLKATGAFPDGDLYEVPGLEAHRRGAKQAMLSLLSRSNDMSRLHPKLKALLPEGWTARQLVDAMTKRHPAIAHYFGSDAGVELMNTESNLLIASMLELARRGTPCLGLHDGAQVPASAVGTAASVMEETTRKMLGVVLPVVEKPILRPSLAA